MYLSNQSVRYIGGINFKLNEGLIFNVLISVCSLFVALFFL